MLINPLTKVVDLSAATSILSAGPGWSGIIGSMPRLLNFASSTAFGPWRANAPTR
jgi:hypothetical protein